MGRGISRRKFVTGAGIGALGVVGLSAFGCSPTTKSETQSGTTVAGSDMAWDKEADVIIIGGGAMGSAACVEATRAGASVILLEKTNMLGGDASICDGVVLGAGSRADKEKGFEVTFEQVLEESDYWLFDAIDTERAKLVFDNSGTTLNWLEDIGCEFDNPEDGINPVYSALPIYHVLKGGSQGFLPLWEAVEASGAEIMKSTPATDLVKDAEGRIIGVLTEGGAFKANKGVILATGSYGGNADLLELLDFRQKGMSTHSREGHEGDGFVMATRVGATFIRTAYEGFYEWAPYGFPAEILPEGGILLGSDAKRFVSEDKVAYSELALAVNAQCQADGTEFVSVVCNRTLAVDGAIENGYGFTVANSVEELASELGLDASTLAQTIESYNAMVAEGRDAEFGKDESYMATLEPPFACTQIKAAVMFSSGGLKVDEQCRVQTIGADGLEVIPGLYAGGRMLPYDYHLGFANSDAITCGRIAIASVVSDSTEQ